MLLKTFEFFGGERVSFQVEIKTTWRVKFSVLNVERPYHGKRVTDLQNFIVLY